MYKKALVAIVALAMISMMFAPAFAWEYPDGTSDTKYEAFGPRADSMLIKMYEDEMSEWETGLEGGEIDITDWPLDHEHLVRYTTAPWNATINVYGYGAEFGAYLFDLNNNNNAYRGNPPDPANGLNPRAPNPMGYTTAESGIIHDNGYPLRHAIAHLVNREEVVSYVGEEAAVAIYTPVPKCYGKYQHPDIVPGGSREDLTHPYDPAVATDVLDDSGLFPIATSGPEAGWRYWDRNHNQVYDGVSEYLELKLIARIDHAARNYMGTELGNELVAQHIHMNVQHITITTARIQWMTNKDAHIYTAGWSFGIAPDSLVLWHWDYYWHPGNSYNTGGCNKDAFNHAADGVQYANTQDDAVVNARIAQEVFCDAVLGIAVYCSSGYKAMSKTYVGDEAGFTGEDWYGTVNWEGYGIDNSWTFMNMHTANQKWGGEIRYGFKTMDLRQLNPIYSEWLWDNTVLGLIGYESLVALDPYLNYLPWVCKAYSFGTWSGGTKTKVVFTLRNDVYFQDGTQLTLADIMFTFIEIDDLLAARGLAPPWWISNVQNILSFTVLDPLNFEVLLDVKSIFALGWIGGNRILPKHIWKPIVTGAIAPKSGLPWDPTTFAPDPNLIGSGPFRLDEYNSGNYILLQANKPGSVVDTGIGGLLEPNKNSNPVTSTKGYFRIKPKYIDIHATNYRAKILCTDSVPPCNNQKWMWVNLTATDHNLWMEEFDFLLMGEDLELIWPEAHGCIWHIIEHIGPDMLRVVPVNPPGPPGANIVLYIENINGNILHCGQVIEAVKTVYVDGIVKVGPTPEFEKPCIPIVETFTVNLTKCFHNATLVKDITTQWFLTPDNSLVPNPYMGPMKVWWPIWVTIAEDITGTYYINTQLLAPDCKVDLKDVFAAGKAFGAVPGDSKWNSVADINQDYKIDLVDYFKIAKKFGKW